MTWCYSPSHFWDSLCIFPDVSAHSSALPQFSASPSTLKELIFKPRFMLLSFPRLRFSSRCIALWTKLWGRVWRFEAQLSWAVTKLALIPSQTPHDTGDLLNLNPSQSLVSQGPWPSGCSYCHPCILQVLPSCKVTLRWLLLCGRGRCLAGCWQGCCWRCRFVLCCPCGSLHGSATQVALQPAAPRALLR